MTANEPDTIDKPRYYSIYLMNTNYNIYNDEGT